MAEDAEAAVNDKDYDKRILLLQKEIDQMQLSYEDSEQMNKSQRISAFRSFRKAEDVIYVMP